MTDSIDTPDVRELAARAMHALGGCQCGDVASEWDWRAADAVLAAVTPVIRQQVAEEIAKEIDEKAEQVRASSWTPSAGIALAAVVAEGAAIARSHSTREEQDHG